MYGIGTAELLIVLIIGLVMAAPGVIGIGVLIWLLMKNRAKSKHSPIDE